LLRVVLDANVFVSAVIRPGGPPGRILERWLHQPVFELILSPPLAEEVLRALAYPKVRRLLLGPIAPELWFEDILLLSELTPGELALPPVCPDPDDDKLLVAAIESGARFVVTGDRELLSLGEYEGIEILSPREFLEPAIAPPT
jgi:putative PIN family toxin of toxin-antitoxin system